MRPRQLNRSTASLLMKTLALILMLTGLAFGQSKPCRPARHANLPTIAGLTYPRARRKLLTAGWRPFKTNASATDVNVASGNGPFFWRRGYTEIESCSGTGVAACAFLFKDRFGNRLRVTTEGEELPDDNAHAHINGSRYVCD